MKVTLKNITKTYPSRIKGANTVTAVHHFSFEIPDGKLVALLGPSGCGKSTTLHLLSGLLEPTEGQIFFDEEDVTHLPAEHRGVGLVFQNYALYPHLTVYKNIIFPLQNLRGKNKLTKTQIQEKAQNVAKLVQIEDYMDRKPAELSGGQQQRVAIARALIKMPRILLLDEPLSNLDARLRLQTREEIRHIQQETGITTVFVTHDQEEAMSISDCLIVMKDGVVQQAGKPQQVYDDPVNLFVARFLGNPPINVFSGQLKGGKLYIGNEMIMEVGDLGDRSVTVAVRPESFIPHADGALSCRLKQVELMGRDISVICTHDAADTPTIRALIRSEEHFDAVSSNIRFHLDRKKVFLFDPNTGERLLADHSRGL